MAEAKEALASLGSTGFSAPFIKLIGAQYKYLLGIRGDNTPEYAKYLGYLDARELYPDFKPVKFVDFVKSALQGTSKKIYDGRRLG